MSTKIVSNCEYKDGTLWAYRDSCDVCGFEYERYVLCGSSGASLRVPPPMMREIEVGFYGHRFHICDGFPCFPNLRHTEKEVAAAVAKFLEDK
jgi:hypothetical protein